MNEEIKVHVIDYGRKNLYMRYSDPITGKQIARSTGTRKKAEANRVAAKWEAELQEGRYKSPSKIAWQEFTDRYNDEVLPSLADRTASKVWSTFNSIEASINPKRLADLTAERLSQWQKHLREKGLAEATIKGYCAHLKASLNWAKDVAGMIHEVPKIRMPQRAKTAKVMKGRAITAEEFERMILKVPAIVGEERAKHWEHLLNGLWWSGLRLGEAVELTWDGDGLRVEKSEGYFMLRIPAESQKSNIEQLLPIAPEFAEMLEAVPVEERTGSVFRTPTTRKETRRTDTVGKVVTNIGKAAQVKVNAENRKRINKETGKLESVKFIKWASAHDLRRAFGTRWAPLLSPTDLKVLMRHDNIETTLKFYVSQDAKSLTERLHTAKGNTLGNTRENQPSEEKRETSQSVDSEEL